MSCMLITRPAYDPGTRYLSKWSEKIIEEARRKGMSVVDLQKEKAVRSEFEGRIVKTQPRFVMLNGHGSPDAVTGHDDAVLVQATDNHGLLDGRITYAVSCSSAQVLGAACGNNTTAYLGYAGDFVFSYNPAFLGRPHLDPRATPFLDASNQIPLSLIKGHTAAEAIESSKRMMREAIKKLLLNAADPDALQDAKNLWWNLKQLACHGQAEARI